MFKSPQQRLAFFSALKNKASGIPAGNPVMQPQKSLPLATPAPMAQSMPSMSSGLNKSMNSMPANPAAIRPPAPMNFLKIRRTLKPKV